MGNAIRILAMLTLVLGLASPGTQAIGVRAVTHHPPS